MGNTKPNLSLKQLWMLSFGFFGVQAAFSLQSANTSRIFATLGADPHDLSYFWILPPLMGMIVQPIVGSLSDKTWCRLGRRIPYLLVGTIIAVAVMCLFPNAGSLGLTKGGAMIFGAASLMLLDTSLNMGMQPFKMMVGDMVNEKQKAKAFSIQSFLCNAGAVLGFLFPFIFALVGISSEAPEGEVPDSVKWSFYLGAALMVLCVMLTVLKVKEMPPKEYAEYHGIDTSKPKEKSSNNVFTLLKNAPKTFWTVGLVQFFCWAAFMYMWTYNPAAVADTAFGVDCSAADYAKMSNYQKAADWGGVLMGVQSIGAVLWALVIPKFRRLKVAYSTSLLIGALGFVSVFFIHNQYLLILSYLMIGVAWAAMLALPFTLFTNSLSGDHLGTYMGLFNCAICLPQIVAALCGGAILKFVGGEQVNMFVVAGVLLVLGALAVKLVEDKTEQKTA